MLIKHYHLIACIAHACITIFFLLYFPYINNKYPQNEADFDLSIRDHLLSFSEDISGNVSLNWTSKVNSNPSISLVQQLMISFFMITSFFHLYYYFSTQQMNEMMRSHNNYIRWIEYSITATIMLYIIALLSGMKDTNLYYMIGISNVVMMLQGQLIERAVYKGEKGETVWIPLISGFLLLFVEFVVILRDYNRAFDAATKFGKTHPNATKQQIPEWVKPMIYILFIFFASFGLVSFYTIYKGKDQDYETIEKIYVILSLLSKTSLGIFVAYGSAQRIAGTV